ncbi:MAG: hypothetical protein JNL88_00680 [Bacteroidia bacterium]|nr:hypothetical protein [Bacteroidia bacterium]
MKKIFPLLLTLLSFLFMGCPYGSEVAIDDGKTRIDEKMIGKWESKSSSDYDYIVSKLDDSTYKIEKKPRGDGESTVYIGFISVIDNTRFLNVWEEQNSTRTYYFYKMDLSGSGAKLTLSPVTENIKETFASSAELKSFFAKHKDLSFFYAKEDEVYIRAD